jgi:anti-anti-sigma regulatory factor
MQPNNWEVTFVRLERAFTFETAAQVKEELSPLLARPGDLVLDLRGATLDSAGLGAILSMQRKLHLANRKLLVVADSPFLGLLDRTGTREAVSLFQDASQAVNHALEAARPAVVS